MSDDHTTQRECGKCANLASHHTNPLALDKNATGVPEGITRHLMECTSVPMRGSDLCTTLNQPRPAITASRGDPKCEAKQLSSGRWRLGVDAAFGTTTTFPGDSPSLEGASSTTGRTAQRKRTGPITRSEMRLAARGSLGPRGSLRVHGSAHGIKSGLDLGAHRYNQRKRECNCRNLPYRECTRRALTHLSVRPTQVPSRRAF